MIKPIASPYYAKLAYILISLIAIGYIAVLGKEVLAPLVFSFLFAMLLLPFARFLENKLRFPRALACMLSVILFTVIIVFIGYVVGMQISSLSDDWPKIQVQLTQVGNEIHRWLVNTFHMNVNQRIIDAKKEANSAAASVIGSTFLSVSSIVLFLVFIFIYTFFILFYRKILISFLLKAFGDESQVRVFDVAEHIQYIMKKYISGLFIEMLVVCAIVFGALALLGVKYALLLALITCLFNLIPYVGIFTAMAISTFLTLGTAGPTKAIEVAACIVIVHLIDSNIIMPRIVGSKVQLNALIVVLGVVAGEMIWGFSGMFLAIPVLAIVKIIFDRISDLKPWGLLLGDATEYEEILVEKVAKKSDSPKEVKQKAEKNDEV
ncbi:MAG: AI-2E family transporter [Mucilaginibacter sp.]|uniref:AI-2E family transporter n=1 Tax=Mucilaginibacter sp. TaxID=1882438 RepID=UPI00326374B4